MYSKRDFSRLLKEDDKTSTNYRSVFRIDYARLLHSPSFRRLQGKTQLFPSRENDFFRNRLTHSLEVAQIAKTIAIKINKEFSRKRKNKIEIDTDLVELAALAHDIGHPPFGHQGEEALDKCMVDHGGFEGNAQTLRTLTKIEKKRVDNSINEFDKNRFGLNLTVRSIASVLKYDRAIPFSRIQREEYARKKNKPAVEPVKGYYVSEADIVEKIKREIAKGVIIKPEEFKTVECSIMDVADDIAYSTYDLEDTLKAGFSNPFDIVFAERRLVENIASIVSEKLKEKITGIDVSNILYDLFKIHFPLIPKNTQPLDLQGLLRYGMYGAYRNAKELASNGTIRTEFTSNLVNSFVDGIDIIPNFQNIALSEVRLDKNTKRIVEVLKVFNYEVNVMSSRLRIVAFRGEEIIEKLFNTLAKEKNGYLLMPEDYRVLYELATDEKDKYRVVCDFIAGMTDKYCIEFYGRLTSENPETIFKPF